MTQPISAFIQDANRSALYHRAREAFYSACHRWSMFTAIVTGSGAFAAIAGDAAFFGAAAPYLKLLALIPAAVAALDITIGFSLEARRHALLGQRYFELSADLAETEDSPENARKAEANLYRLYAEEPPHYRALNAVCHNEIADSIGSSHKLAVTRTQTLLRHLVRFSSSDFAPAQH